jgi:Ca-activated chloride channel family protein
MNITKRTTNTLSSLLLASALFSIACGSSRQDAGGDKGPGATGITQGGAQDFGLFRQILEAGEIPAPDTLDDMGFFAEHKLDYPAPDCEGDLCLHGMVGAMGNMINNANCTILQLGMNSPIEVDANNRPPMHLVLALDVSGSMTGNPISYLRSGLDAMVDELGEEDLVSLVTYSSTATTVLEAVPATDVATLRTAFADIRAAGSTNLYDGLASALRIANEHQSPAMQNRVVFLSDGVATAGLTSPAKIHSLAESYARLGIAITTIGVGENFDVEVMRGLGDVGAGNFYFLADPADVTEVFTDEVKTFLTPVALDVQIDVTIAQAYQLRAGYGTRSWHRAEGGAAIRIPALYLAGRTSADEPIEEGRRGGGGAIIFELIGSNLAGATTEIGSLDIRYTDPRSGETRTQRVDISAPHLPGQVPEEGYFSGLTSEKAFVMLNIYAGFQMATQLAYDADPRSAKRVLDALRGSVNTWLQDNEDLDIIDDLHYIDLFIENLRPLIDASPEYPTPPPSNPWPAD